jgi:hypothetical protein
VSTGDVEEAPALDPISKYDVFERDGAVYIKTDEATLKANRRVLNIKCTSKTDEKVLVIGGCVSAHGYRCVLTCAVAPAHSAR